MYRFPLSPRLRSPRHHFCIIEFDWQFDWPMAYNSSESSSTGSSTITDLATGGRLSWQMTYNLCPKTPSSKDRELTKLCNLLSSLFLRDFALPDTTSV